MATAPHTEPHAAEYWFGCFRLNLRGHELWRDRELVRAPRLIFDCLAYLLEHRDRVVGLDELVSAVWGRVDVADAQVRQLIARVRALVDDNAADQRAIRTVPGVGYRWIMSVAMTAPSADVVDAPQTGAPIDPASPRSDGQIDLRSVADARTIAPTDASSSLGSATSTASVALSPGRTRYPLRVAALAAVLLLCLLLAFVLRGNFAALKNAVAPVPASVAPAHAVMVLPLEVSGPDDVAWVRLGAMDLIAHRLRGAGIPVPPSDNVVSALHAVGEPLTADRLATLRRTLGVETLVQGIAVKSATGWKVTLSTSGADGLRRTAEVEQSDVTDAARQAADLLLPALGYVQSPDDVDERDDDVWELLQRAEAALLANQLDTARSILNSTPERLRNDARIRLKLAQVDQRGGRLDKAQATLIALLDDPTVKTQPTIRSQALTTLGFIGMSRNDCVAAEQKFDAALAALPNQRSGLDAGAALSARGGARACLQRIDAAIVDLSAAGPILEAAGDRLGLARLNNHFGLAEYDRHRPAEALPYMRAAADLHESLGALDGLRNDLGLLTLAQSQLLQWPDALATSERLRVLSEHVGSAAALYMMAGVRACALIKLGRFGEAGSLLRTTENAKPTVEAAFTLTFHEAKAELAWALGEPRQTIAEIENAWQILPPDQMRDDEDVYTILLGQRASIAIGDPVPASPPGSSLPSHDNTGGNLAPAFLVARAEWAAHQGDLIAAETGFGQAIAGVDGQSVPSATVMVVDAYARWLLARQRPEEARAVAGRILPWADRDFECALLQVAVFHALGQGDAWARALKQALALAGERRIPDALQIAPATEARAAWRRRD